MKPRIPPNCDLTLGMTCIDKSVAGVTVWTMTPSPSFANPSGVVQGGFLTAFADSAMSASAITHQRARKVVAANVELKISFLRSAPVGRMLTCTARVVGGGARILFLEAEIADCEAVVVARASSTFVVDDRGHRTASGSAG